MRERISRAKRTCYACPSQWEADTKDGQVVYIRYRSGHLQVTIGPTMHDALDAAIGKLDSRGRALLDLTMNDDKTGDMSDAFMRRITSCVLDWAQRRKITHLSGAPDCPANLQEVDG